ncbi:epoxide hydrolase-like protein [Biscogniauxia mediterranea]|nr:epoxide hydrolase-like protein [Biscogniauxia mediterranea]
MDNLEKKTIQTSRFTYTYYVSTPTPNRLTLLLLHGFPDDAHLWDGVAAKLGKYRLIVPDLLGYSGTSKPTAPAAYNHADLTRDLVEILDAEEVEKVVSVGHDWGSQVAQRLYNFHPGRVAGLVMLNVGYAPPSPERFDLAAFNAQTEATFGYPLFAYQEFFVSAEARRILDADPGRFYDGIHGAGRDWMRELFCVRGNMRKWMLDEGEEGKGERWTVEPRPYVVRDPGARDAFVARFRRDGFAAPLCYYRAVSENVQSEAARRVPAENHVVRVPALYIICSQDAVCRPESSAAAKKAGLLPDIEEATIDSGHWSPYEKPDEIAELMNSFLERRFSS